ncbi:MAG: cytochrome C [Chloroflexi bacterium]|nr:cytochrome C [Chloroflexota bacterium]
MTVNAIPSAESKSVNFTQSTGLARRLYWLPTAFFILAAILMLVSISQPYWGLVLQAPQYPGGLQLRVFVNNMTGDEDPRLDEVAEIDGLNHYIGMKSLYEAAKLERSIAIPAVVLMAVMLVVAAFWQRRWTWVLALPALLFPIIFLADLAFWMTFYGQNLDPYAPLSSSIAPFTPPILGEGVIGQFKTVANVDTGWYIIFAGTVLILVGVLVRLGSRVMKARG